MLNKASYWLTLTGGFGMLKTVAMVFGVFFLVIGVLGFVPAATPGDMLFGVFHVNFVHNVVHLVTGVVALYCGSEGDELSKMFFRVFGVVYAVVAVLGFVYGTGDIFGVMANNMADNWLHVVVAAVSVYFGFFYCHKCVT